MRARRETVLRDMLEPEEGAIEQVVARYQRVSPAVTRFARSLSGNPKLRVRLGSEAAAGDEEIVCDPRLFQAAYNRDAPVTPDEVAIASALHEVVHLVSTDLDERRPYPDDWPEPNGARDPDTTYVNGLDDCSFQTDVKISRAIDFGSGADGDEGADSGGLPNLGAFGGTSRASKWSQRAFGSVGASRTRSASFAMPWSMCSPGRSTRPSV